MERNKTKAQVWVVEQGRARSRLDQLATEEPLEIRLLAPQRTLAITMRTPGADFELIAGFLYSEGIIRQRNDIQHMRYCVDPAIDGQQRQNIVNVALRSGLNPNLPALERHFYTTSACGVCGKASLDALKIRGYPEILPGPTLSVQILYDLPDKLRAAQGVFQETGGLHAAALFDADGTLLALKEDVGRHNALDKLVGASLLNNELPWRDRVIMVSGRSSFEILQKSLMAGVSIICSISAPSSLAVALAQEFGLTLIGFLRGERLNVYAGPQRLQDI